MKSNKVRRIIRDLYEFLFGTYVKGTAKVRNANDFWSCLIVVIILDCLSGDEGSIPSRIAKFIVLSSNG